MKLNKNGWHVRIQKYSLGDAALVNSLNFCPYFWLTIASLIIAPFVFLYRQLTVVLDFVDQKICIPLENKLVDTLDGNRLLLYWCSINEVNGGAHDLVSIFHYPKFNNKIYKRFKLWQRRQEEKGIDWQARLNELKAAKIAQYNSEANIRAESEKYRVARIAAIQKMVITTAKVLLGVLLTILVVIICFLLFLLIQGAVANWASFWPVALKVVGIGSLIVVLAICLAISVKMASKCTWFTAVRFQKKPKMVRVGPSFTQQTKSVFEFFFAFFRAFKENYCPRIDWE